MRADLRAISQAIEGGDPRQALYAAVGSYADQFEPFHNLVLVVTYIRPEKTKGGIIRPDRSQTEDRFQSKIGLVLKTGPLAFVDCGYAKFGGVAVKPGDWIVYRTSDGWEMFIGDGQSGVSVRMLEDSHVKARIADPATVY